MAWLMDKLTAKLGLSPGTLVYVGDRPAQGTSLTLTHYGPDFLHCHKATNWSQLTGELGKAGLYWLHVEGLQDIRMIEEIGRQFGLHQMSLEDTLNTLHRPKMTETDEYLHFIVKSISSRRDGRGLEFNHISLFLGRNFVISFSEQKSDTFAPIFARMKNADGRLRKFGPSYLAFALLDIVVDHYYVALGRLETIVDQMETQILRRPSDFLLTGLYETKRETALIRKMAVPIRDFVQVIFKTQSPFIDDNYEIYFRDLEDHAVQIVDNCESLKETLRNILDVSDSHRNHNINNMFKFFTGVSAVFLPLNFLASVYGMNFHAMPGLSHPLGFFLMCAAMVGIATSVALYFRRQSWW